MAKVKAQVSVELFLMLAFLFAFFVPLLFYIFSALSSETWKLDVQQAYTVAWEIVRISNRLAMGGEGTATTYTAYFPPKIRNISIEGGKMVRFRVETELGFIDEAAVADVNLSLVGDWSNIGGMNTILMNYSNGVVNMSRMIR